MAILNVVPTPIGNLEDITLRALRVLREADLILAEDTRKSGILLKHYEIRKPMLSHHKFNEHKTVQMLSERIQAGENIAMVSDAGTPGISDPGFLLIRECLEAGIEVICLPGPTAFVPALVASGLPCDHFRFEGFLPYKKGRAQKILELSKSEHTIILYESPYRLMKTLEQLAENLGLERKAVVARELTKIHEEMVRGTLGSLLQHFNNRSIKGEIVIIVSGL